MNNLNYFFLRLLSGFVLERHISERLAKKALTIKHKDSQILINYYLRT